MSLYAYLMLFTIAGPLLLSFDRKVAYYKQWPLVFTGILANLILFIPWDIWFTQTGVWWFNPEYTGRTKILELPLEEWSFFIIVPYASIFIYACTRVYFKATFWQEKAPAINIIFMTLCLAGLFFSNGKIYTQVNLFLALILLAFHHFYLKPTYMGHFWLAYFIHLVPFLIINGILTGTGLLSPIVNYSPAAITGIRIHTIPAEDTFYALTCLLLPISIIEFLKSRYKPKS